VKRVPAEGLVGRVALREAATTELNQVMNLVRAALQARYDAAKKPARPELRLVRHRGDVRRRVIVCKDGRYWQFDYTIDAANNVQLAEPKEVIEQFLPVALKEALERERADWSATPSSPPACEARVLPRGGRTPRARPTTRCIIRAGVSRRTPRPTTRTRCCAKRRRSSRARASSRSPTRAPQGREATCAARGWISERRASSRARARHRHARAAAELSSPASCARRSPTPGSAARRISSRSRSTPRQGAQGRTARRRAGAKRVATRSPKSIPSISSSNRAPAARWFDWSKPPTPQEQDPMKEKMLAAIKAKFPTSRRRGATDDQDDPRALHRGDRAPAKRPTPAASR
jgi:hypothetical protein